MKNDFDFVEEFRKLDLAMPKCGSWTRGSENCDYGDITVQSRDCYMCFNTGQCRDTYYSEDCRALTDCVDCTFCEECELCYQCVDCDNCYNCDFCQDCTNCQNCRFSYDLKRCKDCFGCVGLRDKQYYIFNKKYSKEDYEKFVGQFEMSQTGFVWKKVEELKKQTPRMYSHQLDNQNCTGDYIYHSKNCFKCFDTRHAEDSGYIALANLDKGPKDCWDCGPTPTALELCYDGCFSNYCFNSNHFYFCAKLIDSKWCSNCIESTNLFGCNFIKNRNDVFYILNEQVSEEFYRKKTGEISEDLKRRGISMFWDLLYRDLSKKFVQLPDDQLERECNDCGANFEIVEAERDFCMKQGVMLPIYCFECRVNKRMNLRNKRSVTKRKCDRCQKAIISTYGAEAPYRVVCLDCYWEELN